MLFAPALRPVLSFALSRYNVSSEAWPPPFTGYYRYYNKYVNVKKGSIAGLSMVLAAYVFLNYCRSYKELKHERLRKYH